MQGFPLQLSVEQLMARSREIAAVDIVDEAVIEPLTILHRACCEEGQLTEAGSKAHTYKLLRLLSNRLRMQRDFLRHPEIAEQRIEGPIIVMGLARSGTTKLQKALAASGDFNWLPLWQCFNWASLSGLPGESTEPRIAEVEGFCRWFDARSPYTRRGHPSGRCSPKRKVTSAREASSPLPSWVTSKRRPMRNGSDCSRRGLRSSSCAMR